MKTKAFALLLGLFACNQNSNENKINSEQTANEITASRYTNEATESEFPDEIGTTENPDVYVAPSIKYIDFIHVRKTVKDSEDITVGQEIGREEVRPRVMSKHYNEQIIASQDYYSDGDYIQASMSLREAVTAEATNPFVLETYARALYKIPDKQAESLERYKMLVSHLDETNGTTAEVLAIDLWFKEAYWKLGTLYMDNGEWNKAQFEINRFLMSVQEFKGTPIYTQALQFLTECYFELGNRELSQRFAKRTLHYDSNNQYALSVLSKLGN
jgi:tetratricopeptide (TPR) repeat protein